ncbi:MAG TPA: hypothetical protein VGQ91_05325 [Ideonella sp.]|jgi:hypothetical protein|nr:hypothetical protein [Ideonella sp.]
MTMTRKQFLGRLGSGSVVLWLQACGGGGGGGGGGGQQQCGATGAAISGNHGHTLTIAESDLNSTVDMTYNIMGTAGHNHTVTFTVAQLAMLKSHQSVTVTSSTSSAHSHNVTATCV